jgi:Na+/melibiose symporter-like transporter
VAFVPLFVQAVLGTSATGAGVTLTPLLLGWFVASLVSSRLLLRTGYRTLALIGMSALTLGMVLMTRIDAQTSHVVLAANLLLLGIGMGMSIPPFIIAVQTSVPRQALGTATSTVQFTRSIGGALGVSIMGAALSTKLVATLAASGMSPDASLVNRLLDPLARSATSGALEGTIRTALAGAVQEVFVIGSIAAGLGLLATALAPQGRIAQLAAKRTELDGHAAVVSAVPRP